MIWLAIIYVDNIFTTCTEGWIVSSIRFSFGAADDLLFPIIACLTSHHSNELASTVAELLLILANVSAGALHTNLYGFY